MSQERKSGGTGQRGRPREFDRDRALDQAVKLFWRRGYEGVSTAALTRAMRIAPPSLYAAFGSKESLFIEAVERYALTQATFIARAFEESQTVRAGLERALNEAAEEYAGGHKPPGCLVANGLVACAKEHRRAARAVSVRRALSLDFLRGRFDLAAANREISPGTDTSALARFYAAVIQGMSVQAADGASVNELRQIACAAMDAWPKRRQAPAPLRRRIWSARL